MFGYIRKQQNASNNNDLCKTIPQLVAFIILAFYFDIVEEEFDPDLCGSNILLSNNNKTIRISGHNIHTAYGKNVISSTSIGTFIWKIKLLEPKAEMYIGIVNAKNDQNDYEKGTTSFCINQNKGWYAYSAENGYFICWKDSHREYNYPIFYGKYDILTIKLQLTSNRGKLSLRINNEKEFGPYDDILREDGLKYRFAITLCGYNDSVELVQ